MAEITPESDSRPMSCSDEAFGPCRIIEPMTTHTHTIIFLHGRGSTGDDFSRELMEMRTSSQESLAEKLPSWRWVFPSSKKRWSTAFQEELHAWFEAHSLTDITARQNLQVEGIRESVNYILGLVDDEVERLGGVSQRVFLAGISQGGAIGLWSLLCRPTSAKAIGGFVAVNPWLPFAPGIERLALLQTSEPYTNADSVEHDGFLREMLGNRLARDQALTVHQHIPVFLGHATDDAWVDIELGRQVARVLRRLGIATKWVEYSGAEEEGHWFKAPEEIDDIHDFLISCEGYP